MSSGDVLHGASSEPFDVAAIVDQQLATRPDAPDLTDAERSAVVAALEGAAEATVPIIKKLVAEHDRLRGALKLIAESTANGRPALDAAYAMNIAREALDAKPR